LTVESGRMHADGYEFYRSANGVWLAERVPAKYLVL
jgi:putative RNA 2'-phosphotransferase